MGTKKLHTPLWGKICAAVLCAAVVMTAAGDGAYLRTKASSTIDQIQEKLDQLEAENKTRQEQIDRLGGDIASNKDAMAILSAQIDGINAQIYTHSELIHQKLEMIEEKKAQIEAIELSIDDQEHDIELKKQEIIELEAQNSDNLEKFAKLARAMYMNDSSGVIPVLSGSDDWYSYFVYSDVVKNISGLNVQFMNELQDSIKAQRALISALNDNIARLEQDKLDLQNEKAEYEAQEAQLRREQNELSAYAQQQTNYLYGLAANNQQLQDQMNATQKKMEEDNELIEQLNKELEEAIRAAQAAANGQAYTDGFRWPLDPQFHLLTTNFGYDPWRGGNHYGIDIGNAGIGGANVYASQSGTVITAGVFCYDNFGKSYKDSHGGGYGNYIVIDHGNGLSTLYAHLNPTLLVNKGDFVNKGDVIGYVGSTGWSTGYHLHFETRVDGKAVDPLKYF